MKNLKLEIVDEPNGTFSGMQDGKYIFSTHNKDYALRIAECVNALSFQDTPEIWVQSIIDKTADPIYEVGDTIKSHIIGSFIIDSIDDKYLTLKRGLIGTFYPKPEFDEQVKSGRFQIIKPAKVKSVSEKEGKITFIMNPENPGTYITLDEFMNNTSCSCDDIFKGVQTTMSMEIMDVGFTKKHQISDLFEKITPESLSLNGWKINGRTYKKKDSNIYVDIDLKTWVCLSSDGARRLKNVKTITDLETAYKLLS